MLAITVESGVLTQLCCWHTTFYDNTSLVNINLSMTYISTCIGCRVFKCYEEDWLMFNVQRAIFQLYSGQEKKFKRHVRTRNKERWWVGMENLASATGLLWTTVTLGSLTCEEGGNLLNTGPQFYLRVIQRTGWLWIYTSRTTNGRPFKPKKLSVPFLYLGIPTGLLWWRIFLFTVVGIQPKFW